MNWKETTIDLGEVKKKSLISVEFIGRKLIKEIVGIRASCGCTTPIYDEDEKKLKVSFKTGVIPFHLRKQGFYLANKKITITYQDGTFEELFIKAKVTN